MPAIRFTGPSRNCLVDVEEARELATELRKQLTVTGAPGDPQAAAIIIESAIDNTTANPQVAFNDSEAKAILGVLEGWLFEKRPLSQGLFCLRDAILIDFGAIQLVAVMFDVAGEFYPLLEQRATGLAEGLRIKAAEFLEGDGVEGARAVADTIEATLVGSWAEPIPLEGEAAEAVYYALDMNTGSAEEGPVRNLYLAVRTLHHARLERGG